MWKQFLPELPTLRQLKLSVLKAIKLPRGNFHHGGGVKDASRRVGPESDGLDPNLSGHRSNFKQLDRP